MPTDTPTWDQTQPLDTEPTWDSTVPTWDNTQAIAVPTRAERRGQLVRALGQARAAGDALDPVRKTEPGGALAQAGLGLAGGFAQLGEQANRVLATPFRDVAGGLAPADLLTPAIAPLKGAYARQLTGAADVARQSAQEVEALGAATAGPDLVRKGTAALTSIAPILATAPVSAGSVVPGAVAAGLQSYGSTLGDAEQAYRQRGFDAQTAYRNAIVPALASGAVTALITRLGGATGPEAIQQAVRSGTWRATGREFARQVGFEAAEEWWDQVGQSAIAKLTYRPDLTLEQAVGEATEAGLLGGLVGGVVNVVGQSGDRPASPPPLPVRPPPLPLDVDELPGPVESVGLRVESPEAAGVPLNPQLSTLNTTSPATPPMTAAPAATAEAATPVLSPPTPAPNPNPNPAPISSSLTLEPVADVPEVPGVPTPLEGPSATESVAIGSGSVVDTQAAEPGLLNRPEAAMQTRPTPEVQASELEVMLAAPPSIRVVTPDGIREARVDAQHRDMDPRQPVEIMAITLADPKTGSYVRMSPPPGRTFTTLSEAANAGFALVRSRFKEILPLPTSLPPAQEMQLRTKAAQADQSGATTEMIKPAEVRPAVESQAEAANVQRPTEDAPQAATAVGPRATPDAPAPVGDAQGVDRAQPAEATPPPLTQAKAKRKTPNAKPAEAQPEASRGGLFKSFKEALGWALDNVRGTVRNEATGFDIEVTRGGLEKAMSASAVKKSVDAQAHMEAMRELPELLRSAKLTESRPATKQTDNISAIHRFVAPFQHLGQSYRARITVREHIEPRGRKFYTYELSEIERPASERATEQPKAAPSATNAGQPEAAPVTTEVKPSSVVAKLDAAIEALKTDPTKLQEGVSGLPVWLTREALRGALIVVRQAVKSGQSFAQAVQAGVRWLQDQSLAGFTPAEAQAALEQAFLDEPGVREHVGKRLLQEDFSPAAKAAMEKLLLHEVKPDEQLFAEAAAVVEAVGPREALANYFGNPWGLPADAHAVLGFAIGNALSTLETQARAAGDAALADRIGRENAEFQSQFVLQSTETARTLRAYRYFDLVGNLSPFTADVFARKVTEQATQKERTRLQPTLDAAKQQLDELNRAGIEEAARTPESQTAARTAINQTIEAEARQAGTPIQQAIAAEVVAQLQTAGRLNAVEAAIVREHFGQNPEPLALADKLERAGVKPAKARAAELEGKYKDGVEAFRAKLRQKLAEARQKNIDPATLGIVDRAIRQRLAELQVKLGTLVRQHWTQQERAGQQLAESLVNEAGLPEAQATRLAEAIQRRFKALVQARKEKALRNLAKTPAARTLQQPTVAQRIIEATNLGALDSEGLWNAVAEKLGLPTYTAEASAEVKRLAERAQQLPEGSVQRQEATARLMRFIARQKGVDLGDLGWSFWYANTLSGPLTHAVNTFSNVLSLGANTVTQFRDVAGIPQILAATAKGFRTGLTEGKAILRQGPGANRTKFTEQGQALENLDAQDFTGAGLVQQWRYVARALAAADAAFYFPAREAKAITLARALAKQEGKTGAAIRQQAQTILDGTEQQQNEWGAQVDRERAQLEALGEKPDALWSARRLEQLREQSWGADLGEAADDFALRTTYNNVPYGLIGTLADVAKYAQRRVPGARAVVPFVNVVANVVNDSINYTPWGFARAYAASRTGQPSVTLSAPFEWAEKLREGKSPITPDAVVDLHAKAALGTAMLGSLMAMALAGLGDDDGENFQLYGSGPKDDAARKALRETGWIPYSVRVNGKYFSFANTPLAVPLGAMGHYLDGARYDKRFEQADAFNRLGVAMWGGAHVITQMSFLDGLARLLGALEERRGRTDTASDRAVEQAFRSVSNLAVPNALRQLDRFFDPTIYDNRGIEGALVASIPFARRNGSPALNALGEPITSEPWKRFASDAEANVWTDLARRRIYPSVADKAKNAQGREMTDDEHYRYVQESGAAIKRRLETPGMRQMIRNGKEEAVRKAVTGIVREERDRTRSRLGF